MGKQYHFLAGLQRSGNTVLSAILNQHPEIYVSPISALIEHMWVCHKTVENYQSVQANSTDKERSVNMISKMIDLYYSDVNKPIIIDRSKSWTNQANIDMIKKYLTPNPKIIFTTRSVLECIASTIAINKQNTLNVMEDQKFLFDPKLKENENIAEYIISEYSNFGISRIFALESIDNPDNKGIIHIVKYEDLLSVPQETMDGIYDFLELESFKHNFKNIRKLEEYKDTALGFSKDLHKVRRILGKGDIKVEEYLTPYTIEKYKNLRYY